MHNEVVNSFKSSANIVNHQSKLYFFFNVTKVRPINLRSFWSRLPLQSVVGQQSKCCQHQPGCMVSAQCRAWKTQKNCSKSCCFWSLNHWIKELAIVVIFFIKSRILIKESLHFRCVPVLVVSSTEQQVNARLCGNTALCIKIHTPQGVFVLLLQALSECFCYCSFEDCLAQKTPITNWIKTKIARWSVGGQWKWRGSLTGSERTLDDECFEVF